MLGGENEAAERYHFNLLPAMNNRMCINEARAARNGGLREAARETCLFRHRSNVIKRHLCTSKLSSSSTNIESPLRFGGGLTKGRVHISRPRK